MEDKTMRLEYSSALLNLVEVNPSFDMGTLRIAYTGKNRNRSFISKEAFERAIPSMYGCPVVANYMREENEIGSHDGEFVSDDKGNIDYVNITQPVGFVPPGAAWKWEVLEDGGEIHQYLTTEVILWKRQEAYKKIKDNGVTKQSMEISVNDGEMLDDYYNIIDFYFTAFCLLGTAEPCFESASLFTFECKDQLEKELSEMFEDFKLAFAADERFRVKEGDETRMDKFNQLLEQYNVTAEDITFEVEGLTDEELEAAFAEAFTEVEETPVETEEEFEEEVPAEEDPEDAEFEEIADEEPAEEEFALAGQIRELLGKAVHSVETIDTEWGSYSRYYMVDYDESASEVYFEDSTDWNLYGASYSFNGDNIVVDFENMKRKKYSIIDFDEGEEVFSLKGYVEQFVNAYAEKSGAAYTELEERYNALVKAENERVASELFAGFEEKLGGMPEFEALKKSSELFDLTELEDKLYALVGRKQFKLNKNVTPRSPKAPVIQAEKPEQKGPYGDLFNFMKK